MSDVVKRLSRNHHVNLVKLSDLEFDLILAVRSKFGGCVERVVEFVEGFKRDSTGGVK